MATKPQPNGDDMALLKRALRRIEELERDIDAAAQKEREPIAVIGMGCRLPGGIATPDALWAALRDGVDLVSETPAERWDADAFYDPTPGAPGKMYSKAGAFLDEVDNFDPQFFGIAPREAKSLDPQQRLLLEVSWEALENAGQSPDELAGDATGVFVGIGGTDYQQLQMYQRDVGLLDAYHASGMAHSVAAGRISYALGLTGPSLAIDTACSSSLVAIHYACLSLRNSECRLALAGGVNVMLAPFSNIAFSQSSMLSPAGRCATFDAAADGFVQGEGCGVIVLKRLSDALDDGDRIDAVIRGSAVNQDGASSGLTAPNGPSQEAVILAALADGGVRAPDVSYIEAHGSGTPLGDPIEVQALAAALGRQRSKGDPLLIGSIKTNAGHLATAAGVAGLIKVVLAMQARQIPPHLHFDTPNPHIPWAELPIEVATALTPWQPRAERLIAGVSGFGFSGTNVHVVLEEAPAVADDRRRPAETDVPLVLSAKSDAALRELATSFATDLAERHAADTLDVVYTADTGRSHFKHRLLVPASTSAEMAESLAAFASGTSDGALQSSVLRTPDAPRIAFLFSGSGAEYAGMGRQLYATEPCFRRAIDRCDEALASVLDQPVSAYLDSRADQPEFADWPADCTVAYPILFAVEYALATLWRHWGIEPWAVSGYGTGEYVAACVAGALSLEDAIGLAATRGRLTQQMASDGAMAAVFTDSDSIVDAIRSLGDEVSIAAINGPRQVVVSGTAAAVQRLRDSLARHEIHSLPLNAQRALQSALMDPLLDDLEAAARRITVQRPDIGLVSGVTGQTVSTSTLKEASHWRAQAREPIRFQDAIETLRHRDVDVFLEIGADAVLTGLGASIVPAPGGVWLPSLRRGEDERRQMIRSLGALYLRGSGVDWRDVFGERRGRKIVLPGYPFERERYWIDGLDVRLDSTGAHGVDEHPLLGTRIDTAQDTILFAAEFGVHQTPELFDHVVHGIVVVPAAAIIEMAIAAAERIFGCSAIELRDVSITEALTLADDRTTDVQLVVTREPDGRAAFALYSRQSDRDDGSWRSHAAGTIAPRSESEADVESPPDETPIAAARARCTTSIDVDQLYHGMWQRGLTFGDRFRTLERLLRGEGEAYGEISASAAAIDPRYRIEPATLDACIQVVSAALTEFDPEDTDSDIFMPIAIDRVRVHTHRARPAASHARLCPDAPATGETRSADLKVADAGGRLLLEFHGLHLKRADPASLRRASTASSDGLLYEIEWQRLDPAVPQQAVEFPTPAAIGDRVQAILEPLCDRHGVSVYESLSADLDALCAAYTVDALGALGFGFDVGREVTVDGLLDELGIAGRHARLLERMLDILCEEGLLRRDADSWTVAAEATMIERPATLLPRLLETYRDCDAELRWTRSCGDQLAAALRGDADPHELLFPGGDTSMATTVYSQTPIARLFNGLTAEAIRTIVAGQPADQRLNVLEIGAGTGATSEVLLAELPASRARFTFSDIGPAFVNQASRRFADSPIAEFRVLDIERDPGEQGLTRGQFDVIVASNVLHATADLRETVERVEGLLAPGGLLLLLEVTAPQRWFDLTVGLTDGWWRFEDRELRSAHPLLTGDQWTELLETCGFDSAAVIPESAHPAIEQAMIVARKAPSAATASGSADEAWCLFADETGAAAAMGARLEREGTRCIRVHRADRFECVAEDRYALDPTRREHFEQLLQAVGATGHRALRCVYLWPLDAGDDPTQSVADLVARQESLCGGALHLVQALSSASSPDARLALVTRGAQYVEPGTSAVLPDMSTLWGLNKAITLEHPELHPLVVDVDPSARAGDAEARVLIEEIRNRIDENEIALRLGEVRAARLQRARATTGSTSEIGSPEQAGVVGKPASGLLDDLTLDAVDRRRPGAGEVEIRVSASALNFRDVLVALDVHHDFDSIGSECAGQIVAVGDGVSGLAPGDEVIAIAPRSLATHAIANAALTVRKPTTLDVRDAVTLPIAFLTADYALHHVGRMTAGDVVLIHAAAGGVGLAAVQLAERAGATVLATAGSKTKRDYLRQLGIEHVMNSRDGDFGAEVMRITEGRGVDMVLNGLTGALIDVGLGVLAPGGRFLELGKSDIRDADSVRAVNDSIEYHAVDLTGDMLDRPESLRPLLDDIIRKIESGDLSPLPWQEFPLESVADAFRFMEQARHVGKVVITQGAPDAAPATDFRDDGTYLIIGGLSGLGERVAEWAVQQGARHLMLASRREPSADNEARIAALESAGASVAVAQCDVAREDDVRAVLDRIASDMPPLRGVFHSAGVLDDGLLLQQEWRRFDYVMAPKVAGAWALHSLTRDLPLDFFVMFSSIASLLGGSGAANHSAANAYLDALAHSRRRAGLPALSINWGAWSEIGAAVRDGASQHVASQGLGFISPEQGLDALDAAMHGERAQLAVMAVDWATFFARDPEQAGRPLLAGVVDVTGAAGDDGPTDTVASDFARELAAAYPNKRPAMIEAHVTTCAAAVLGLDAGAIDPQLPLSEMGMDSLMAVELRNTLKRSLGQPLPATLLFDFPTVSALSGYLAQEVMAPDEASSDRSSDRSADKTSDTSADADFDLLESIENLSDEEVDRAFGEQLEGS